MPPIILKILHPKIKSYNINGINQFKLNEDLWNTYGFFILALYYHIVKDSV